MDSVAEGLIDSEGTPIVVGNLVEFRCVCGLSRKERVQEVLKKTGRVQFEPGHTIPATHVRIVPGEDPAIYIE